MNEHLEPPARRNPSIIGAVVAAVLVSTVVATLVGGIAGVLGFMIAQDQYDARTNDDEEIYGIGGGESDDAGPDSDSAFTEREVAWDSVVQATLEEGGDARHVYAVTLPDDAVYLEIELTGGDVDLDLRAGFDRDDAENGEWEATADGSTSDEILWFARMDDPAFGAGPLYVEVKRYDQGGDDSEYELRFIVVRHAPRATLRPGDDFAGTLLDLTGYRADLEIVLPAGTDVMRLDLVDVRQDLNIAVDAKPVIDPAHAAILTDSLLGREHVVIDRGELRLPEGDVTLHATIIDAGWMNRTIPFRVLVTEGAAAPPEVAAVTMPLEPTTPEEKAAASIVGILTSGDEGSGVIVRESGIILTAAHLVADVPDGEDDVTILVLDDARLEPMESLVGKVVRRDDALDIAVVQVTRTLHGNALPTEFRLPAVPVRWSPRTTLAEPVHALGYPVLHQASERSELTWTRGVIAGFEAPEGWELLRFDAEIRGGSSGGALLDAELRLVGITIATHEDSDLFSSTGLALPMDEIPEEWLPLLR